MAAVAGVDGCRTGWVVAWDGHVHVVPTFAAVLARLPPDAVVAIDIPIGLPSGYARGGRECDRLARRLLGRPRGSSVFPAPPRPALGARDLPAARDRGWPATLQGLNILPKIEEIDSMMSPSLQRRVFEAHPELGFFELNGQRPLATTKHERAGRVERWSLLAGAGITRPERPRRGETEDDVIDACAALWIGRRIADRRAVRVPTRPSHDDRGLRMEIWR
jgi:predicted RNase H-like nuclease